MSDEVIVYKVDASRVSVRVGEVVHPETAIGDDYDSDEEIKAGVYGTVELIRFNGWDHSMDVVIRESVEVDEDEEQELGGEFIEEDEGDVEDPKDEDDSDEEGDL